MLNTDDATPDPVAETQVRRGRDAAIAAALEAWEEAGLLGLCPIGRWEYAVDAMRQVDPAVIAASEDPPKP